PDISCVGARTHEYGLTAWPRRRAARRLRHESGALARPPLYESSSFAPLPPSCLSLANTASTSSSSFFFGSGSGSGGASAVVAAGGRRGGARAPPPSVGLSFGGRRGPGWGAVFGHRARVTGYHRGRVGGVHVV